jgi:hypothetical protein
MQRKLALVTIALLLFLSLAALASADLTVGVKRGDWIEYVVSYSGSPTQGHALTWARMDILGVNGVNISVMMTSQFADGSRGTINTTMNLETGHLIDDFVIPANLNVGDTFLDENLGNVTIAKSENGLYAGATRTVLASTVGNNTYVWDQSTGVSVEGNSQTVDYTIHTIVVDTNMWQPQPTPNQRLDFTSILLVLAFGTIILIVALLASARYIRRKACEKRKSALSVS